MNGISMLDFIRANRPDSKPQLWENVPRAIARRIAYELLRRLRAGWLDSPHVVSMLSGNARFEVVPRDAIGKSVFLYGTYELAVTRFVQAVLRPGDVFLDVGANAGYYTVVAGELVGPGGAVHAFEPVDRLRERLLRNVQLNRLANVAVHPHAVWSRGGPLSFFVDASPDNTGLSSAIPGPGRESEPITVNAVALDDFVSTLGRPVAVVKIDVEGGETAVLDGAREVLSSAQRPVLVFEAFDAPRVAAALAKQAYEVKLVDYSMREGLRFLSVGEEAARASASYEPPNYVALPVGWSRGSWGDIRRGGREQVHVEAPEAPRRAVDSARLVDVA